MRQAGLQCGLPFYSVDAGEAVAYYVCNGNHLKATFLPLSHVRLGQMQVISDLRHTVPSTLSHPAKAATVFSNCSRHRGHPMTAWQNNERESKILSFKLKRGGGQEECPHPPF